MGRFLHLSILALAIATVGPCTAATRAAGPAKLPAPSLDPTIEGVLTDEGQQCPAMRTKDGHLYTLTGDLRGFKPRDHVCVVPDYPDMTYCLQGTTAHIERIAPGPCPPG